MSYRVVAQVVADAEKRSRLIDGDLSLAAGYDKGFFIKSADENFLLKTSFLFQFRGIANWEEDGQLDGGDNIESGFEIRRFRTRFTGNAFSKDLTYDFQLDYARNGGNITLLDGTIGYRFAPEWQFKFGQWKQRFARERDVGPGNQLAVDRSFLDALIGGGLTNRVQGVALVYGGTKENNWRVEGTLTDGAGIANTDFRDGAAGFGSAVRVEYKLMGDWSNYNDFTAKGTKDRLAVVGAGVDYTDFDSGEQILYTADLHYETAGGFGLMTAVHGRSLDARDTGDQGVTTDWGALAQASYLVRKNLEPFARYSILRFEDTDGAGDDTYNEITVGVNYYLGKDGAWGNRAKLTVDAVYLPDGAPGTTAAPGNLTGMGYVAGEDAQFILRAQFTLQL